jgi:trehalose utilization protein
MVFLTERVEQLLIDRVHKEVLEALPPLVEHTLTIKKVASILMAENSQIKTPIFQTIQAWHL